jgi:pimeloyl-ACP methyl ester carboxylesterase
MKLIVLLFILLSCSSLPDKNGASFDKDLTDFSYPFEVQYFNFSSQRQKLSMAYMDLNSSSNKVIVLLHGKNFSGYYWERIANDLTQKGYRVIIPDQIGFGKSTKPEHYHFSFPGLINNTMRLLAKLNVKKFELVGHSMGGMMAMHFAYLHPKNVERLILINPIGLEPYLKYVEFKDPEFFYGFELKKTPEKFKAYQKKNYYDGKWKSHYDHLLMAYSGQMRGDDWPLIAWNNALSYGPIFNEDITSKFNQIKTKTFLIIGTRDTTGPGRKWKKDKFKHVKLGDYKVLGKKANKALRNSTLFELEGIGHMPQFEDYSRFWTVFRKSLEL